MTNQEAEVLTVSQLTKQIKSDLEENFLSVWVQGEISNFTAHSSGHFYFSLKDDGAQISAVMFRGANSRLKFRPENGLEVIVRGRISVYGPRGSYQIVCDTMEPVGAGALQKAYEQLKAKLQAEGLFDPKRKRAIPKFPRKVAIITSPTGAAIRDMLNVLNRRNKTTEVLLVPCQVQGDRAAKELTKAMQTVNQIGGFDVIIIGRGGGSIEDLWAFNDEALARAVASSKIPTVSAVGHEIDFTICDFVADLRAPTPSAAAELIVCNVEDLAEKLLTYRRQIQQSIAKQLRLLKQNLLATERRLIDPQKYVELHFQRLDELQIRLQRACKQNFQNQKQKLQILSQSLTSPEATLSEAQQRLAHLDFRLQNMIDKILEQKQMQLTRFASMLDSLSPLRVLERGYTIVKSKNKVIRYEKDLKSKDKIQIQFSDGEKNAIIE